MRIAFKTLGCRLNQAETDRFAAEFADNGWLVVPFGAATDAVVIHSCAVTHTAERDSLRVARGVKRHAQTAGWPAPFVALVGCTVDAVQSRTAVVGVDLLVSRSDQTHLRALISAGLSARCIMPPAMPDAPISMALRHKRALLKIQDGCDFHCAYCIVPHTRGLPVSRSFAACLKEAADMLAAGFHEIVLAGCNVGCYRDGRRHLPDLVTALAQLDGLVRIRLSSIEPSTVEREMVDMMAACSKLCRQLHLPLQSGDADILRAMGRHYTPEDYQATVAYALARVPDLGLGCDVIVGFPGETPAAFERTRRMLVDVPFSNLHIFPYSERPGTSAVNLPGAVPLATRKARARTLIALLAPKRQAFAATFIGRPVEVLIETVDSDGQGRGWSSPYLACCVADVSRTTIGSVITFTPTTALDGLLVGHRG